MQRTRIQLLIQFLLLSQQRKIIEHGINGFNYVSKHLIKEDLLEKMFEKIKRRILNTYKLTIKYFFISCNWF